MMEDFRKALETLINKYSLENNSNTPDWILAEYLVLCLKAFDGAVAARDSFWGKNTTSSDITSDIQSRMGE
jgi:hypothetical protein